MVWSELQRYMRAGAAGPGLKCKHEIVLNLES